jgi:AraC family transcriptional regulator
MGDHHATGSRDDGPIDIRTAPVYDQPPALDQLVAASDQAGWPDVLVRSFHCPGVSNEWTVPAYSDDLLILQLAGAVQIQGSNVHPFPQRRSYAGDIYLVPHTVLTAWRVAGSYDILHLSLAPAYLTTVALHAFDIDPAKVELIERVTVRDPLLLQIGLAFQAELLSRGLAGRLYVESLTTTLALHLLRQHAVFPQQTSASLGKLDAMRLRRIVDYIDAYLAHDLSLPAIAAVANLSPYHFARLFKHTMGQSLHQYVIAQRLRTARRLIETSALSLAEIAAQVGFADQSHLTRHFKRVYGVPPATFVAQRKNIPGVRTNLQDLPSELAYD